jgi:hypothetical protein
MNTHPDLDQSITAWLEAEAPERAPERLLSVSRDRIRLTRQRRLPWPARGMPITGTALRLAVGVAAVVALAVIGVRLLPDGRSISGPNPSPSPSRSPSPTPTPLTSTLAQGPPYVPASGLMESGRYRLGRITFTVPDGWTAYQEWAVLRGDYAADPPDGAGFVRWRIGSVYADPCHWSTSPTISTGSTVDDVVNAFKAQDRGGHVVTPIDVTVEGYRGKLIDLVVPAGIDFADCDQGEYHSWISPNEGDRYNQGPGQHDVLRIVDVGGTVEAILTDYSVATSAAVRAELQAMVDSVVFDTPAASSPSP